MVQVNATSVAAEPSLTAYTGRYEAQPWGSESAVVVWEDGLAHLSLPSGDPMGSLTKLRKTGDHTFRRVRSDGALGETVMFEMGPDGRAVRYLWHGNTSRRITP